MTERFTDLELSAVLQSAESIHEREGPKAAQAWLAAQNHRLPSAESDVTRALLARYHAKVGLAYSDQQYYREASAAFTEAVHLHDLDSHRHNRAAVALALKAFAAAADDLQVVLTRSPRYRPALVTQARLDYARGSLELALNGVAQAAQLDSADVETWLLPVEWLVKIGRYADAARWLQQAATALPHNARIWKKAGEIMAAWGHDGPAAQMYQKALALDTLDLEARLGLGLALPLIPDSKAAIQGARERLTAILSQCEEDLNALLDAPVNRGYLPQPSPFFLAYHGEDDRAIQESLSRVQSAFLARAIPQNTSLDKPTSGPKKVGFVSRFFYSSTVAYYFREWVSAIAEAGHAVTLFSLHDESDAVADALRATATWCTLAGESLATQAETIRARGLDLLIYPEVGIDGRTRALAALRLAPRQWMGWGHPVTSGLASIDVALTSDEMEPPKSEASWSETLVRLPGIGTRYRHAGVPNDIGARSDYGLPESGPLILYPQSLFKIHPDNDAIVVAVLKQVQDATLIMFQGQTDVMTQKFVARLSRAFAHAHISPAGRIRMLPNVDHTDYLRITQHCTLMLDTLHWSGGNTSLDAIACGLPIATLPGRFMRGRQSAGMLRQIGCTTTIAQTPEQLIDITVALLTDPDACRAVQKAIQSRGAALFDQVEALKPLLAMV
jgi:protein O-GlcNAc transferase